MDFRETEEQKMIRETIREFSETEVLKTTMKRDLITKRRI